eukprot:2477311-Amphidinium_carterae.1
MSCAGIATATRTPVNAVPIPKSAIFNSLALSFKSHDATSSKSPRGTQQRMTMTLTTGMNSVL